MCKRESDCISNQVCFRTRKIVIEGAASVGIAALMNDLVAGIDKEVVAIISSRNINMDVLHQILCQNGY